MRKISARGFIIIRLCSATVPTDSIYEKKKCVNVQLISLSFEKSTNDFWIF